MSVIPSYVRFSRSTLTTEPYDALGLADDVQRRVLIGGFGALTAFVLGSLCLLVAAFSAGGADDRVGTAVIGLAGLMAGGVLTAWAWRIPIWVMDVMNVFAVVGLVVVARLSPVIRPTLPGVFVVLGMTLFAMRAWRPALAHTALIGVGYAAVLAVAPHQFAPATRWFAVMAAVISSGAFIRWLVSTVAGIASMEHQAWREAERATAELERTGRAKSEFLARMSHELRTPLNVVLGFADLLHQGLAGALNPRQHEYTGDIADSARLLVSLVDDVLDPEQVARGEIELLREVVDVPTALFEAVRLVRDSAAAGGIELDVQISQVIQPVYVDRRKFRQVVVNLLVNAIKFTAPGGHVIVSAYQQDGELLVSVGDTGIGIAKSDLDRIFEEFARSATAVQGTGLGLPLAKRFVELHGGRLTVRSTPGSGSTFTVALPYRTPRTARSEDMPGSAATTVSDHAAFTQPGSDPNRELLGLLGSWFAVVAAGLLLVFAVITPVSLHARLLLLLWALAATAAATATRLTAGRLKTPGVEVYGTFGILAITLAIAKSGPFTDIAPFAYAWVTMTTFALWPRRRAIGHLIAIGIAYGTLLVARPETRSLGANLSAFVVVIASAIICNFLLTRLRRLVVAEQTARVHAEEVRARLDSARRHKDAFVANMSHELRTPLNAVIGFADLLSSREPGPLSRQQAEYVDDIRIAARHLLAMIDDILDLAKLEAGRLELEWDVVTVAGVLHHAAAVVRDHADSRGITVHVDVADGAELVRGDQHRLSQVVVNLATNAVKFTPDGGRVDLSASRADGEIVVVVRDTGIGVLPEQRQSIFESFSQGQQLDMSRPEGAGVGLALVDGLVGLHGGQVSLDSQPERGSTFVIRLPGALSSVPSVPERA